MRSRIPWLPVAVVALALARAATPARAMDAHAVGAPSNDSLQVTLVTDVRDWIPRRQLLEFRLSRPLDPADGTLVLEVGGVDVTALAALDGTRLTYRPAAQPLPSGSTTVNVYRQVEGHWTPVASFPLRVLTAAGFSKRTLTPSATLGSRGRLAEGGDDDGAREVFRDVTLSAALGADADRAGWSLTASSSYLGVTRRQNALRYGQLQDSAPRLDLSDYRISIRHGRTALTVGNTAFGGARHLANAFAARGATLAWGDDRTTLTLGALNATPVVGWDHPIGLDEGDNRMVGLALGHDFLPPAQGAFRVEATAVRASILPRTGFTQGAIVDAEASDGGAVQLTANTPGQRLRLSGGIARSRFANPRRDPQLLGQDTLVASIQRDTRGARFVDVAFAAVPGRTVRHLGQLQASLAYRGERIDPLYRSVTASLQADRAQHAGDATLTLGPVNAQLGAGTSRDNVDRIPTLLTTLGSTRTATASTSVAQLLHVSRNAAWLPMLSYSWNTMHQRADGPPDGNVFRPTDLPDQVSRNRDLSLAWNWTRWRLTARSNRADQDNRQPLRQLADFASGSDALTIGTAWRAFSDLSLDLGRDFQHALERDERSLTRRATLNASLQQFAGVAVVVSASLLRTQPPTGPATLNGEQRIEATRSLLLRGQDQSRSRGQAFLRFARSTARLPDFLRQSQDPMAVMHSVRWALVGGLNLRVF